MNSHFHCDNRKLLCGDLPPGAALVFAAGNPPRKSADAYYPHFANRNFLYLTGIEQAGSLLLIEVMNGGARRETLYLTPPDPFFERWNGSVLRFDRASELSGIENVKPLTAFERDFDALFVRGKADELWLDLDKHTRDESDSFAFTLARELREKLPHVRVKNALPILKKLRTVKADCEIEAMRRAEIITGEGIAAMVKAAKPGMREYQLRAEFEYVLAMHGAAAASPPHVSSGVNNFCIHYSALQGTVGAGDLILCDVGASWDNICTDVSRAWPVSGRFSDRQKLLYQCAFDASEYIFGLIRPGMPHGDVDKIIREYTFERLRQEGICRDFEQIGTYMWHAGAHHVGLDVHDAVESGVILSPGMVFCVDVGIYHEEWGVGFRLEDNCLVTENGCENLSARIRRTIAEIEGWR